MDKVINNRIKKRIVCYLREIHLKHKDIERLKEWKAICHVINPTWATIVIAISDKVDLKAEIISDTS